MTPAERESPPPSAGSVFPMITAYMTSQVIYVAARHPEAAAIFNEAMTEGTRWAAPALIAAYDFSRFQTIVDVAGGNGTLLAAILAATPGLRATVFDLAMGVADARRHLEAAGVA